MKKRKRERLEEAPRRKRERLYVPKTKLFFASEVFCELMEPFVSRRRFVHHHAARRLIDHFTYKIGVAPPKPRKAPKPISKPMEDS